MLSFLLSLSILATAHAAAPANDSILKATVLAGNFSTLTAQDLTLATSSTTDPLVGGIGTGKTLWYRFPTPVQNSALDITIKSTTAAGTALIFRALDPDNLAGSLVQLASSPFTAATSTTLTANASSSQQLLLMVVGTGVFEVAHRASNFNAANDFPQNATTLTGTKGTVTGDTTFASVTADEPSIANQINTVWFKWVPTFNGQAFVDTNFSFVSGLPQLDPSGIFDDHNTVIAVFSGSSPSALTPVTSDATSGWNNNSRAGFTAVSGTTYFISVGTASGTPSGAFQLNFYQGNTAGEIDFGSRGSDQGATIEGSGTHPIEVRRRYAADLTASCTLAASSSSATAGTDFTAFSRTVSFTSPAGGSNSAWEQSDAVIILDDTTVESTEQIALAITAPVGATLGTFVTGTINLVDDDTPRFGMYMPVSQFRIVENQGSLNVTLVRNTAAAHFEQLRQSFVSGTAVPGFDFTLSTSTIFANNTSSTVTFSPVNDKVFQGDRNAVIQVNDGLNGITYSVIIEDDDLYIPVVGKLTAQFSYADGARQAILFATISSVGSVTGKLIIPGQSLPFTGKLDARGKLTVAIAPKGRSIFMLTLAATNAKGGFSAELLDAGTVEASTATAVVQNFAPGANACPFLSLYTFVGSNVGTISLNAAGTVKVDASGNAVLAGKLFDGTPFTASGFVDGAGQLSVMASLFANQGCVGLNGLLPLTAGSVVNPSLRINRPARANDPAKIGTFVVTTGFSQLARYTPPTVGQRMLDAWVSGTGKAVLSSAPLPAILTKALTISTTNIVGAPLDTEKLKITLVPATGVFTGSFVLPGTTTVLPIYGAVLDLPLLTGTGKGFFFNGLSGGLITIGQP